jgi:N-acetylneuraminic acid mutarotase
MATLDDEVVLFGGNECEVCNPPDIQNDTWIFDGTSWTQVSVAAPPPARESHAMASLNGKVVMFGGDVTGRGMAANDTWTFDGTSWTEVSVASPPPARVFHAMATLDGKVVMFGGATYFEGEVQMPMNDTWTFDGASWTEVSVANPPSARCQHAMAPLAGVVELFGGTDSTAGTTELYDTWAFDGTTWAQMSPLGAPPARSAFAMATVP